MTLTEIRAALDSRGLRPLKQLGQNFLHDQNLAKWLAEHAVAGLDSGANVVEIGPGLGALTSVLLEKNLHLIALEKDRGLVRLPARTVRAGNRARTASICAKAMRSNCCRGSGSRPRSSAAICPTISPRRC